MSEDDRTLLTLLGSGLHPWQHRLVDQIPAADRGKVTAWLGTVNKIVQPPEATEEKVWLQYVSSFLTHWQWELLQHVYFRTSAAWHPTLDWFVRMNADDPSGFEDTHDLGLDEFLATLEPAERRRLDAVFDRKMEEGYGCFAALAEGEGGPAAGTLEGTFGLRTTSWKP